MKFIYIIALFLVSCNSSKKNGSTPDISLPDSLNLMMKQGMDLYASGNQPVRWTVQVDFDKTTKFQATDGINLEVPSVKGLPGAGFTSYKNRMGGFELNVMVYTATCDENKDRKKIEVTVNNKRYSGCGGYLFDSAIQGKWILEKINNKDILTADFPAIPFLQTDLTAGKVSGSDGCNILRGSLEVMGSRILFSPFALTKRGCNANPAEKIFSTLISGQLVDYYIKNEKLVLYLGDDSTVTFGREVRQ